MKINNRIQLMTFIRNLNLNQRQDCTSEQAKDMLPVFEHFGLKAQAERILENFDIQNNSNYYSEFIQNITVNCDLEKHTARESNQIAINISNLFGCYDFADALKL